MRQGRAQLLILGMVIPPLIGNPLNWHIENLTIRLMIPTFEENNGSLDPSTHKTFPRPPKTQWVSFLHHPCDLPKVTFAHLAHDISLRHRRHPLRGGEGLVNHPKVSAFKSQRETLNDQKNVVFLKFLDHTVASCHGNKQNKLSIKKKGKHAEPGWSPMTPHLVHGENPPGVTLIGH